VPAAGLIVLAAIAAYHNSLAGPFVLDDDAAIAGNPTIRHLWPIWTVLSPPREGETVSGRPLLNLTLAINYAHSGLNVRGYHATNLAIHIAAALLLFGILRRTFLMPALRDRFGSAVLLLALASTLLWTVHPLQAESVTYVVQRAESLMGLFYLLTLYCVIRGAAAGTVPGEERGARNEGRGRGSEGVIQANITSGEKGDCPPRPIPWLWYAAAVLACLLGMATKEVMVTAPLVVLLYDRTFLAGSFGNTLRQRWGLYAGFAATWVLSAYLVLSTGLIFRQSELLAPDRFSYARSQPGVILHYLQLSFWPRPLCLVADLPAASRLGEILPAAMAVGLLLAATVWGLMGRKACGFLGAWFFLILAPTSSIFPLRDLAYEHRMYLPLAAVAVLVVAGGYHLWDRLPPPAGSGTRATITRWAAPAVVSGAALVALGCATLARNAQYQSQLTIWQDSVEKRPASSTAHNNLGIALASEGRTAEAIEHYQEALRLNPANAQAHNNLGLALGRLGRFDEAVAHYRDLLRLKPDNVQAHNSLAAFLAAMGKTDEAIEHYHAALRLKPDEAAIHNNLGNALASLGRTGEALDNFREALRLKPELADAHCNLGLLLAESGKTDEALDHYHEALRLKPDYALAHNNLAASLFALGKTDEAIEHYREALRLKPDDAATCNNLGNALADVGRTGEALTHYREALRLKPELVDAHCNLGILLAALGRTEEAIERYREALRLNPDFANAHYHLGLALFKAGKIEEAVEHYRRVLKLMPNDVDVLNDLAWLLATREPAHGGDPVQAMLLARRACELSGRENAQCLDTLAAACAAAGRYAEAVTSAQRALKLAEAARQTALAKNIRSRLELYRAGQPYRQPGNPPP